MFPVLAGSIGRLVSFPLARTRLDALRLLTAFLVGRLDDLLLGEVTIDRLTALTLIEVLMLLYETDSLHGLVLEADIVVIRDRELK